jgi:hypothetical protein
MLTLLTCSECDAAAVLRRRVHEALAALDQPPLFAIVDVASLPDSDRRRTYPAPTLLWQGRDLFEHTERSIPYRMPT